MCGIDRSRSFQHLQLTSDELHPLFPQEGLDQIQHARELREDDGLLFPGRAILDILQQL